MDNTCVCCGEMIPEGRQVCYICEKGTTLPQGGAFIIETKGGKQHG